MPSKKSSQFLSLSVSQSVSQSQSLRRAVVCGLCVAALVGAVLLPVAPASAATRFTNGERMEGSFFDHLADGLAGDPDGGEGVTTPQTLVTHNTEVRAASNAMLQEAGTKRSVRLFISKVLVRLISLRGGTQ